MIKIVNISEEKTQPDLEKYIYVLCECGKILLCERIDFIDYDEEEISIHKEKCPNCNDEICIKY